MGQICSIVFKKLRDCLITFLIFVRWQRLIAQNVAELFSYNHGVAHFTQLITTMSWVEGPFWGMRFSQTNSSWLYRKLLVEIIFLLVFYGFSTNLSTMMSARAKQRRHLTNGSIQWLLVKRWMCSIVRCTPHRTATSAWWLKLPAIRLHFFFVANYYGQHKLKPSYCVVVIDVMSLFILYGRPPSTMDAISATVFDGGQAIHQKHE